MIEVFALEYTKAQLAKVPEDERTFFLVMTSLANDLAMLQKQMQVCIRVEGDDEIVKYGAHAMAMLNLRMLAGRLYEGWKSLKSHYPAISPQYQKDLSKPAQTALTDLQAYFDPPANSGQKPPRPLIPMVRDKIGFHADYKTTAKAFADCPDDAPMGEYICKSIGNTLYYSTEMVHLQVVAKLAGKSALDLESLMALMDHTRDVARWLLTFVSGFVKVFANRHFAKKMKKISRKRSELSPQPNLKDIRLPFFVELG